MVELLGLERLTNAFGIVTMCQGLSAFIGAPIAGASEPPYTSLTLLFPSVSGMLFDATGTYHSSFYFAGVTLGLAGVICLPLRRIARWQKRRKVAKQMATKARAFGETAQAQELLKEDKRTKTESC